MHIDTLIERLEKLKAQYGNQLKVKTFAMPEEDWIGASNLLVMAQTSCGDCIPVDADEAKEWQKKVKDIEEQMMLSVSEKDMDELNRRLVRCTEAWQASQGYSNKLFLILQ